MDAKFEFELNNRLLRKLANLAGELEDARRDAYGAMEGAALKQAADRFRSGTDPNGTPWAPLASRDGQTLVDTGRLRASFATRTLSDGVEIGTNVSYAPVHQFGATIKPGTQTMHMAKNKRGQSRFVKKSRAGKKGVTTYIVQHSGRRIPARPMLPIGAQYSDSKFVHEVFAAANRAVKRYLRQLKGQ